MLLATMTTTGSSQQQLVEKRTHELVAITEQSKQSERYIHLEESSLCNINQIGEKLTRYGWGERTRP